MRALRRPAEREDPEEPRPRPRKIEAAPRKTPPRRLSWGWIVFSVLAILVLLAALLAPRFDEYFRRTLESKINQRLHGYTVALGHAHVSPFSLALTLRQVVIRQQAHPEPPVVQLPRLEASVEWREILRFHLVADAVFDHPRVHVDLTQLRQEDRDAIAVEDRGWQDAFQAIYPLKFNRVEVWDGEAVYVDRDPKRPLELAHWNLLAENIRNTRLGPEVYPSPIHSDAVLFGSGHAILQGHADFLSKPYPGVHAVYRMAGVPLERLGVLSARANLELHGGLLDSQGEFELGPRHREARLADVTVRGLRLDYLHTAATSAAEKERAKAASRVVKDDQPLMPFRIDRLRLTDSILGWVNRSSPKPFRLFLDHTDLTVTHVSSGFREGPAQAKLTGRFMGTGVARASATLREPASGPDFDFNIAVENAALPTMNDLLRSYGKLDVAEGKFSVYSEIKVARGRIAGYVKPLIKDVRVYDSEQDKKKPILKKLYEKIAGGLSHLLENRPRDEVATVVDLSGPVGDPDTSTWDIVVRLIENAFVKAILPGFDREFEAAQRKQRG